MKVGKRMLGVMMVLAFGVQACGGGSGGGDDHVLGGGSQAQLRVVHLSPDAPAVDALVNDSVALAGATFPSGSDYLSLPGGIQNIKVNVSGTSTTVIEADLELSAGVRYTVAAVNRVAAIEPLVLTDNLPDADGNAAVRIVHAAPSAPNVDIYATVPGADLSAATPVLTNVPFKTASGYLSVPPGQYQFRVTVAGTKTVAIDSGALTLSENQAVTAFARDANGGGTPFGLLLLVDRG